MKKPRDHEGEETILLVLIGILLLGLFALYGEQATTYLDQHKGEYYDRR